MLVDWFCILAWVRTRHLRVVVPVSVWLLTVVAYVLPIMYVVSLFVGQGRTPYDLISGTVVISEVHPVTSS